MKPTAHLVNTLRWPIVDEASLTKGSPIAFDSWRGPWRVRPGSTADAVSFRALRNVIRPRTSDVSLKASIEHSKRCCLEHRSVARPLELNGPYHGFIRFCQAIADAQCRRRI
jgi:hypothetical protein